MNRGKDTDRVHLFSYGTLRTKAVQLATFGRELDGRQDSLPGYRRSQVKINDPNVAAISGANHHPIAIFTGNPSDSIDGMVFSITEAELAAADGYEVSDYKRVAVRLASGTEAWVYVAVPDSSKP
jgi:gamma-glutamylcyclotransferase (GGCT)/AIG2-like uncharacterized protein YtfP